MHEHWRYQQVDCYIHSHKHMCIACDICGYFVGANMSGLYREWQHVDLSAVLLVDMSWLQLCPSGGLDSLGRPFRREASPIGCSGSVSGLQHAYFELCLCCRVGHAANSRGHARDKRMLIGHSYVKMRWRTERSGSGAVALPCRPCGQLRWRRRCRCCWRACKRRQVCVRIVARTKSFGSCLSV